MPLRHLLSRELKLNCNEGNCKLMVVLDGVNSLFSEQTLVNKDRKMWKTGPFNPGSHWIRGCAKVDECSVPRNIKKLLKDDYKNAVIITSACSGAVIEVITRRKCYRLRLPDEVERESLKIPETDLREKDEELTALDNGETDRHCDSLSS